MPVTTIASDCAVLSPKWSVATPEAFVVTTKLVDALPMGTPFALAKYPAPELVSVNATPFVWTKFPYWSSSWTVTAVFVEVNTSGFVGLSV